MVARAEWFCVLRFSFFVFRFSRIDPLLSMLRRNDSGLIPSQFATVGQSAPVFGPLPAIVTLLCHHTSAFYDCCLIASGAEAYQEHIAYILALQVRLCNFIHLSSATLATATITFASSP